MRKLLVSLYEVRKTKMVEIRLFPYQNFHECSTFLDLVNCFIDFFTPIIYTLLLKSHIVNIITI